MKVIVKDKKKFFFVFTSVNLEKFTTGFYFEF